MKIRTNEEIRMFEDAINRCRKAVFLVTPDGRQYDMKTPSGFCQGMTMLLNAQDFAEPELFTTCFEDEMVMFEYISNSRKIA